MTTSHLGSVGTFVLERNVHRGLLSSVWLARSRSTGDPVAVKVLPRDGPRPEAALTEVYSHARLAHPGIVEIYDVGVLERDIRPFADDAWSLSAGSTWLAVEWVAGGTLADRGASTDWLGLRRTVLLLLDALAHAHARGIVHRDLKPSNVGLTASPEGERPRLLDFGIAHRRGTVASPAAVSGTPHYMAPEQIAGAWRDYGPWTDLYALGCLVWGLTTGRPPFAAAGDDVSQVVDCHLHVPPPPMTPRFAVPDGLRPWLDWLLDKNPRERPLHAAEAALAFAELEAPQVDRVDVVANDQTGGLAVPTITLALPGDMASSGTFAARNRDVRPTRTTVALPGPPDDWQTPGWDRPAATRLMGLGLHGLRDVPMVGREQARHELWQLLHQVHKKRGVVVALLEGAAGVGKTRLSRWLGERAAEVGAASVMLAPHGPDADPGEGLAELCASYLDGYGLDAELLAERVRLVLGWTSTRDEADVTGLLEVTAPAVPTVVVERPAQWLKRTRRLGAVARLIVEASRQRPVILRIEDGQWGPDALGLVAELEAISTGTDSAVLVLVTARLDEGNPEALGLLDELRARPTTTSLRLDNLGDSDMRELCNAIVPLHQSVVDRLLCAESTLPIFVVEVIGGLVGSGELTWTSSGWSADETTLDQLPNDLVELWRRRLHVALGAELAETVEKALELAAIWTWHRIDVPTWKRGCDILGLEVPAHVLRKLSAAGLLDLDRNNRFAFKQALFVEVLVAEAEASGRAAGHHAACVELLLDRSHEVDVPERLAHHLELAGRASEALHWLRRAAIARRHQNDYVACLRLLDRHDALADQLGEQAPEVLSAADAQRILGLALNHQYPEAITRGESLLAAAHGDEDLNEAAAIVCLALGMAYHITGRLEESSAMFRDGIARFEEVGQREGVGLCRNGLGQVLTLLGDRQGAIAQLEQGLRDLQHSDRLGMLANLRVNLADALQHEGRLDEAVALTNEARNLFVRAAKPHGEVICLNALGEIARRQGDFTKAAAHYQAALDLLEVSAPMRAVVQLNAAIAHLFGPDPELARPHLHNGDEALERIGMGGVLGVWLAANVALAILTGTPGDLSLDQSLALLEERGDDAYEDRSALLKLARRHLGDDPRGDRIDALG